MKIRSSLVACAVAGALAAVSMSAMACSTVIVGKDASATGDILIGHNEDNGGRIFNPQYYVPPTRLPSPVRHKALCRPMWPLVSNLTPVIAALATIPSSLKTSLSTTPTPWITCAAMRWTITKS